MTRDLASERQVQSADPRASTWLSANAGSGKTRVLTDRVARLLLNEVEPQRILCLTYTKAAASEMQNRLFRRLGAWAMLEDGKLRHELQALGIEDGVSAEVLIKARRLFARAIETPGGLRIQTIHSFCATLLRRFPLEADVSPQFTELDDRAATLLRDEIIEEMADTLAPDVITALAHEYTGEDFAGLAQDVAAKRANFNPPLDHAACCQMFGLDPALTESALLNSVLLGGESALLAEAAAILAGGSANDAKLGVRLAALPADLHSLTALADLEGALLFGISKVEGKSHTAKLDGLATKATAPKLAHLQDRLNALGLRVESARAQRIGLQSARRTAILHAFAAVFLPEYAARKQARGALDFDDLIMRAKALLTDPAVAQWVLFRLDGGIDHILVDEAQDTSPDQWRVIELLAQEFTSGQGARDVERTIFVVGDQKQSIYSFQGADVSAFSAMRETFAARLASVGAPFQRMELEHSFRSSPAILRLVDLTFGPRYHENLGGASTHLAFWDQMPGRIELWPPIASSTKPDPEDWADPVDLISEEHHAAQLARQIAERIRQMIDGGAQIPDNGAVRPVHAGDFLILVRRRAALFQEVIRACKAAGLPIAGADRLKLGGELAVKDLASLLAFLATPEDDLALAEALRSPLLGWTEKQLFQLAQGRKGFLWEALRRAQDQHPATMAILNDLRNQADFLRPFDLIERALTRHDGRRKLLARLGDEAEDGIDELLSQALAFERNDVPSLTGFLTWLQTDDVEVKRQADAAGARIRVMTVHGAKGLEAPIVILPDTADQRLSDKDELFRIAGNQIAWRTPADASPPAVQAARQAQKAKALAESKRLLYVALTRAQSMLIVAAAGDLASQKPKKDDADREPAWYDMVAAGLEALGAEPAEAGRLVYQSANWPTDPGQRTVTIPAEIVLPDWAARPAPKVPDATQILSPSNLGGAKVLPGDYDGETDAAKLRGTLLHLLLEHLPKAGPEDWHDLCAALLPAEADRIGLLTEAQAVLQTHANLFAEPALTEVAITARLGDAPMLGTIDRLVLRPDSVLALDFKSNSLIPQSAAGVPEGLLRQLGAYSTALQQIYPDKRVEMAILWTKSAVLMPVG